MKATMYYYDTRGSFVVPDCVRFSIYRFRSVINLYLFHYSVTLASIKNSVAIYDAAHPVMRYFMISLLTIQQPRGIREDSAI
jgi:hypothetical protein